MSGWQFFIFIVLFIAGVGGIETRLDRIATAIKSMNKMK